jgi:acyl-CoA thioesterase
MHHPFADLIDLQVTEVRTGSSKCTIVIVDKHLNPHSVVHGAVLYALADTGMGAALYPTLSADEICATIQITCNYFKPVRSGTIVCNTELINRGKTVAHLESQLFVNQVLVASANGNYSIFKPSDASLRITIAGHAS